MSDKTAIELIYEIHEALKRIEARQELLEKEVRLLNDKANGKLFEAVAKEMPKGKAVAQEASVEVRRAPGKTTISPERLQATQPPQPQPARQQNVRVFGKFADQRKKPIADIEVTILDANNRVIKQTKTNRAGEWLSFLPPGQYSAEFIKEGLAPQFRAFQIVDGQTEVEVM